RTFAVNMHLSHICRRRILNTRNSRRFQRLSSLRRLSILRKIGIRIRNYAGIFYAFHLLGYIGINSRLGATFEIQVREVIIHCNTDLLDGLWSNTGTLFELLRSHISQGFHCRNAGGNQLLDDRLTQLRNLLERSSCGHHRLHLLLDFLTLLLFALDVNLPSKKLGSKTHMLSLLADSK